MAVVNIRSRTGYVWVPPEFGACYQLTVERSDGTIDDITDKVLSFEFTDGCTDTIGNFKFTVSNVNEEYTTAWHGLPIVRLYIDYAATPSTLRFRGRIEKPSGQGNMLVCTGRSESQFVIERQVTKQYDGIDAGDIIVDLFSSYGEGRFDTSTIPTTGILLTEKWVDKPFWECVQELCRDAEYDCYISAYLIVQFFEKNSVDNETDALVHDMNIIDVGDFAPDLQFVKNQIRVLGATIDGIQVIATANDAASQALYGIRSRRINDDSVRDENQARQIADAELAKEKDPPIVGDVLGTMLASVQPGERIWTSAPYDGLDPDMRRIVSYTHSLDDEYGLTTKVNIERESKNISHVMRDRIVTESSRTDVAGNPADMDYSYSFLFDSDSGTHASTSISAGALRSGSSSATWYSPVRLLDTNLAQCYVDASGERLDQAVISVSGDGGASWQAMSLRTLTDVSAVAGTSLQIRIVFSLSGASVDSLNVQYTLA